MISKFYIKGNSSRMVIFSILIGSIFTLITSCTKWDPLTSPVEGTIYMAQSNVGRSKLTVFKIDSAQSFTFGASVAGFDGAPSDVIVDFEVDNSLLAAFNEENAFLGYNFIPLPEDAYEISRLETTIKKGESDSDPLSFNIWANKLNSGTQYGLPIRIKSVSEGQVDTSQSISYFMVDSLSIRTRDITGLGILTVSKENNDGANANEGSVRLTDDDYTTKFLFSDFVQGEPQWMQLKFESPLTLSAYTFTSGNDAQERDPKNWKIQGSDDGDQWTTLDERQDYSFTSRLQTVTFEFNQPDGESYSYYRFLLEETGGSNLFQMTEWRLLEYY